MKKKKTQKKVKILLVIILILAFVAAIIGITNKQNKSNLVMTSEVSRTQAYEDVTTDDEKVYDENNNEITAIRFDAFFLKDKNGDGVAEKIRGTCNEIGTQADLYMDLSVLEGGHLTNGKITINSKNFYFNTAIVKDNEIFTNYISSNTKEIKLNDISNGFQKLLMGSVRAAIGNDTTNYSKENSITFSGTYVDNAGNSTNLKKEIPFIVDWYGAVDVGFYQKTQTKEIHDWESLKTDEGVKVTFDITTTESKNQLIMSESNLAGAIPELNGYKPLSVKISGTNVKSTYDSETGAFTAKREATLNENAVVKSNAYTSAYYDPITGVRNETRYNLFDFTIIYPIEAYETLGNETSKNFELKIPITAQNKGYNNPHSEDGFVNPYVSNIEKSIITISYENYSGEMYKFNVYVGKYSGNLYNTYIISKQKPLNIYNRISLEEKDDTYTVQWQAITGEYATADGIIMKETPDSSTTKKSDNFLNTSSKEISMKNLTSNKGIYFNGAEKTLGNDGWIKVYNDDTNELIETFRTNNWNSYSSSNPYLYKNKVNHIRVETSSVNTSSNFYVYNIKELDDEYITDNFTRKEFDELSYVYSYLTGHMVSGDTYAFTESPENKALYVSPTSVASILIKEDTISTKLTAENEKITIGTETDGYNMQGWKNGIFLVKLPNEVIMAKINSVKLNNSNVKISAYDIYEENGSFFIKILTENEKEEDFYITIDCDLTPDPRIPKTTGTIELYAINETACDYGYTRADKYDLDGDSNTTEYVSYRAITFTIDPGSSLSTTQIGSNYGEEGGVTIAPRVAKADKQQRTAKITVSATNNYTQDIQDIKIQGVVPFEGNAFIISGKDMGSTFTTYMGNKGIQTKTSGLSGNVTIYYSTNKRPTNDINEKANGWTLAKNVKDWTKIKTYIIVLKDSYKLAHGETIEFEYEITIPQGVDYNEVTFSEHAIYFALDTKEGLYHTSTGSDKLGFMIAKQYDLEIVKKQQDKDKKIQGVTFTLTEDGQDTSSIKVTDANGIVKFTELYAEKYYTLKEVKAPDDYVLNSEEIKFYTKTKINEDGTESLYLVHNKEDNIEGTYTKIKDIYECVKEENIYPPDSENQKDYKIQLVIENEVKAKLKINKIDMSTKEALKNVTFTITGQGKGGEILKTDKNGNINVSGLYLGQEYTLEEIKATGYYIPRTPIKFTIRNNNGTFELDYTDNGTTKTQEITTEDEIPTINLNLQNEKIPTYGLQLTKYAKGEKVTASDGTQKDKTLERAQFKIVGEGIKEGGKIYTTDENGILTIDDLYEYVNGKYIIGEYTLTEIYPPEGYSVNPTSLKFKAYRENGTLKIQILEGEDLIRGITTTNETTGEQTTNKDLTIENASATYPLIKIGVENDQIFTIFKYTKDGEKQVPIPGTKFAITDLDGNSAKGSDGNFIGEWFDTTLINGQFPLQLSSTSTYKWTQRDDGTWESTGNYHIKSSTSTLTSNEFEIKQNAKLKFDWAVSSQSASSDYVYYIITNIETKDTIGGTSTKIGGNYSVTEYKNLEFNPISIDLEAGKYKIEFVYRKNSSTDKGLDAGYVKNVRIEGKIETPRYAITTDENGQITANLPEGLYKAVEVYTDDKYVLDEDEADRTYYFGIGKSKVATTDLWAKSISGKGLNKINSIETTKDGEIIAVGAFTKSSSDILLGAEDGVDTNNDGNIDKISEGAKEGIIVSYNFNGKQNWCKSFGGEERDTLNKIIQTSDEGYVVVGYTESLRVKYDGEEIPELAQKSNTLNANDAVILKLDKYGNYQWGIRLGGKLDDEIQSVIETSEGNIVIVGKYFSKTFNFCETGNTEVKASITNQNTELTSGFIASYTSDGKYQWNQVVTGTSNINIEDITEYSSGLAIAVNKGVKAYVRLYSLTGTYSKEIYIEPQVELESNPYANKITSLDTTLKDEIIAGVNYTNTDSQFDARVYRISPTAATSTSIYELQGTKDEYVSDVKAASDGGIILGGWYYSTGGLDVDKDGATNGKFDFTKLAGQYTSDGFTIKIDEASDVVQAIRFYGDGYEGITSVAETTSGNIISAGYFNGTNLSLTSATAEDEENAQKLLLESKGNSEGFVCTKGETAPAIAAAQRIEVENKLKDLKITTEVIKHTEGGIQVTGGDITGEVGTIDGVRYSKDTIRYIENVDYGNNSTKTIKITPDAGYAVANLAINGEKIIEMPKDEEYLVIKEDSKYKNIVINDDGTITIEVFNELKENIHVAVEFNNTIANLVVNHYLWTEADGVTTTKVADSEYKTGNVGTEYSTAPKVDIEYEVITNGEYYGAGSVPAGKNAEDLYIPDNYKGTYTEGTNQVVNYYYKEKTYTLIVHHYIAGTNEQVPLKGSTTGEKVEDEFTEGYKKGSDYTTTQAGEDKIDYSIYELVEVPINATGTIEGDTEVIYYYQIKTAGLKITKVAEENHEMPLSGTEFALYKKVAETEDNNLIDTENVGENWALVSTYATPETGIIKLEDLPITEEYRLVETKSATGRLKPDGQWKIEFVYGEYDETDTTITTINGQAIRVTAIGNPPALAIENGELLLPNKEYYNFPTSGNIGTSGFYKTGAIVVAIGLIILFLRKRVTIVKVETTNKTNKNKVKCAKNSKDDKKQPKRKSKH